MLYETRPLLLLLRLSHNLIPTTTTTSTTREARSAAITTTNFFRPPSPRQHFFSTSSSNVLKMTSSNNSKGGAIVRTGDKMGLKQLFDEDSSTYSYLLWDSATKDAIVVDPVDLQVDRDIAAAKELGLNLVYGVNTHAHADHITGTWMLKEKVAGLQSVISEASQAQADNHIRHGDRIVFGSRYIEARATPGHTAGCLSYVADDQSFVLTGDALLILGCGRTDFQGGSAETLYDSVHSQLFSLPDDTVVYPAHDYKGRTQSLVGEEKAQNPRLGGGKTKAEYVDIMANLNLAYPKKIDAAVPANMRCGAPDV